MGSDLSVVNAARVSFGKKSEALGTSGVEGKPMTPILNDPDKRLIKYLAKHKHMSPFGHAFASFHVKAPIFVARQLVKHKFLRWNEISRRYVDDEPEFYMPDVWRGRSADKKQGSDGVFKGVWPYDNREVDPNEEYEEILELVGDNYSSLIDLGLCPEQARMLLPQSTMTEWYWSGSLDAFMDMCNLRCKLDTQYETRLVAEYILSEMINLFPVSVESLRR
jgi:thymidylate synthase (FAD)